jgi:peptide-methionine (S)-S-oxide reductase
MLNNLKLTVLALLAAFGLSQPAAARDMQTAIVAGGCFWCVEADFEKVQGVTEVKSGYTGGTLAHPTYKAVSRGGTGHYEAVLIEFDADQVSYRQLIDLFLRSIDPMDAGGQFCDRGAPYRTGIFVQSQAQSNAAVAAINAAQQALGRQIVTPVLSASTFFTAEAYHQDYYKRRNEAYKFYRKGCRRDARVRQIWGSAAPFAG